MNELIKLLDDNLEYINHKFENNTIYISVISIRKKVMCPYCKTHSEKVHSKYEKSFQDLPIQGKKVIIVITNRKMFCSNNDCSHKTFAEKFDFIKSKAKKTKRLEYEIINLSINVSSITASYLLTSSVATVSKSTVCNLLKKRNSNN